MVSIPVFSDAAFVMLFPILKAMAKKARVLIGPLAVALAIALANTANFVAPTPAPWRLRGYCSSTWARPL
jgi:GntP family gluconate:H+ symporter